ncbi:MAG TPA: hypothetical protein PK908_00060 [Bacteroidales bacterium]|nr:hypothetical protein [Bacteroidales bacterium]
MDENFMLIIVDKKMPEEAKQKLGLYGELLELQTSGIVYPSISGHPDIFFCQTENGLVAAPGIPDEYIDTLKLNKIEFVTGKHKPGSVYPFNVSYNAVVGRKFLIHNLDHTDPVIADIASGKTCIHTEQGYTRCNLISLGEEHFITSDQGIQRSLKQNGLDCTYFSPQNIYLQGFKHGFLGGTCGILNKILFICGSLKHYEWADDFRKLVNRFGFEITELTEDVLFDVGSIIFIRKTID